VNRDSDTRANGVPARDGQGPARADPAVFVVVAAHNEARVIRSAIQPLADLGYTVVVVDDASTDDTSLQLSGMPVHVLRHRINLGQGAALQTGMAFALRRGARFVVHFDADGQHRAEDVETLLAPLRRGDADVALGSRFLRRQDRASVPLRRRLLLKGGVVVNGLLTGLWLTDAHNGMRAFTATAAARIDLRENRFAHASEILNQIRLQKLQYVERPTTIAYTAYSMAKGQSAVNAIKIVIDLLLRRILR
jgi:glycosyltransferase involved in cell wall biosynthesis